MASGEPAPKHPGPPLRVQTSAVTPALMWPSVVRIPLLGVTDTTLFLAARAEHYWGGLWLSGCKVVWWAIWFWAATRLRTRTA